VWETSGDTTSGAELLEIYLNMSEVTDYTNKNVTINMYNCKIQMTLYINDYNYTLVLL